MNKIDNEEIDRLMRVTSEPLRRNWEKVMINGGKLEDIISSREYAIKTQKACKKNSDRSPLVLFPLLILTCGEMFIIAGDRWHGLTLRFVLVVLAALTIFSACIWTVYYWSEKSNKMWRQIAAYDLTLGSFKDSVDALNPLGIGNTYHDLITAEIVAERVVDLAYKVVDAEDRFERSLKPGAIRTDVMNAGEWINKCTGWFDCIWRAATISFALPLIKKETFARAVQDFINLEGREPAHLVHR